jgi:hypothetical protein
MSVQKRLRERKKAEKAELKRMSRRQAEPDERPAGSQVAARSDLEAYGLIDASAEPAEE